MLHRAPSSLSSFSSYDSFYSDPAPPIMAHDVPISKGSCGNGSMRPISFLPHQSNGGGSGGGGTLSRAHKKLALKAQKLSLSSLGSELSHSCSALYSMLTDGSGSSGGNSQLLQTPVHCFPDQTEAVSGHTLRGIEFLEKYGNFVKERALLEDEYAAKLKNLVKKNLPKKKEDDIRAFSYGTSFHAMLGELESLASQHEVVAERLKKDIHPTVLQKAAQLRQTRKTHLNELQILSNGLSKIVEHMEKNHRNYAKAFKEAEAAYIKYDKNEKNMDLSRAELEKSKNNVNFKNSQCEEAKQNYAASLEQANHAKRDHYENKLPNLLRTMRNADVERITETRLAMQRSIEAETGVMNIVQKCYDDMLRAVSCINADADTRVVVEQNASGYAIPHDFVFDDFGDPSSVLSPDNSDGSSQTMKRGTLPLAQKNTNGKAIGRKQSMHQKFFGSSSNEKAPKANGNGADYGHLPPQQRCRKIQARIEELQKEKETLQLSLTGVVKMVEVYKDNPKLGNPNDVEPKIKEYHGQIAAVDRELTKMKTLLEQIQTEMRSSGLPPSENLRSPYNNGHPSPASTSSPRISSSGISSAANTNRTSYSEDSVSSDGSGSFANRKPVVVTNGISMKPMAAPIAPQESVSARPSPPAQQHQHDANGTYEEFDLPALGTCVALYPFEGGNDGTTVTMREGEEMLLLEKDEGDGWTRIRHLSNRVEGFVPTSYLNCRWYPV